LSGLKLHLSYVRTLDNGFLPGLFLIFYLDNFSHVMVACSSLKLILKTYSTLIRQNLAPPARLGVDISGEER